jgi:hypothetical protein
MVILWNTRGRWGSRDDDASRTSILSTQSMVSGLGGTKTYLRRARCFMESRLCLFRSEIDPQIHSNGCFPHSERPVSLIAVFWDYDQNRCRRLLSSRMDAARGGCGLLLEKFGMRLSPARRSGIEMKWPIEVADHYAFHDLVTAASCLSVLQHMRVDGKLQVASLTLQRRRRRQSHPFAKSAGRPVVPPAQSLLPSPPAYHKLPE